MKQVIDSKREPLWTYFKNIYRYRSLVYLFAKRGLKVQYAQTAMGIIWSAIQPLTGLLIFTLFFDKWINIGREHLTYEYPLFAFSGMVCWYYFTFLIGHVGNSLINQQHLITKVYFPKLILPLSTVLVGMVEFCISLVLLFILMLFFKVTGGEGALQYPTINIIFMPLVLVLVIINGLAIGIWLSALTVRYRDFQHIIPYIVNFGIWLTPVFYPNTIVPKEYQYIVYMNPMAGTTAFFRWALMGDTFPEVQYLYAFIPVGILLFSGIWYFRKVESKMADMI